MFKNNQVLILKLKKLKLKKTYNVYTPILIILLTQIALFPANNRIPGNNRNDMVPISVQMEPPTVLSPADGAEFSQFPRTFTMRWQSKPGIHGAIYDVEIDCNGCINRNSWDSGVNASRLITGITDTSVQYTFPGDNTGRWRVRAKIGNLIGKWSPWRSFRFKSSVIPFAKPNISVDPFLRIDRKIITWGNNNTIVLTPKDAFYSSGGKYGFNIQYTLKNTKGPSVNIPFKNYVFFNDEVVSQQTNLTIGPAGRTLPINTPIYLTPKDGILKVKIDAGEEIDEEWENDNVVWVNIKFIGF